MQSIICPKCGLGINIAHDFKGELECPCGWILSVSRPSKKFPSLLEVKAIKKKEVKE